LKKSAFVFARFDNEVTRDAEAQGFSAFRASDFTLSDLRLSTPAILAKPIGWPQGSVPSSEQRRFSLERFALLIVVPERGLCSGH